MKRILVSLVLVAAMVVPALMVGMDTAVSYSPEQQVGVDRFKSEAQVDVFLVDTNGNNGNIDTNGNGNMEPDLDTWLGIILSSPLCYPTVVKRTNPAGNDGNDPRPPEPDLLNDIATEIVSMELTGTAGPITITIKAGSDFDLLPSTGAIEELAPGTDFPAYSFFDIFFELTLTPDPWGWGPLTNSDPARMKAVITDPPGIPPYGIDYTLDNPPVILQDSDGIPRVLLDVERHTPLGPPDPCPVGGIIEPMDTLETGATSGESSDGTATSTFIVLGIGGAALFSACLIWFVRRRRVISTSDGQ